MPDVPQEWWDEFNADLNAPDLDLAIDAIEDSAGACSGLCVTGSDVGVGGPGVAYPHPMCPEHGEPHEFRWNGKVHNAHEGPLRWCECGAYEDEHPASVGTTEPPEEKS